MRPSSRGLAADARAAPVSLGLLRSSHPRCTTPSSFRVVQQRLVPIAAATSSGDRATSAAAAVGADQRALEDRDVWKEGAFPSYLQSEVDDFCASWSDALQKQDASGKPVSLVTNDNPVWQAIRREARADASQEPLLSSFYHASILSHDSFARSLAFVLANRLADATLLATELFEIFHSVLREHEALKQAALLDIVAFYERDPACITYSAALLYFKGYHAIQTHRIANVLWNNNRKVMAMALQARVSEVLAIDLHPGATLGKGLLLDHGTGIVIGETSRVGDNVSIMQNVTLGGTGKDAGNRHPKVQDNVLIGAGATVLGNITVGKGAQVAAGSLVLRDVPPKIMVAGSPARPVGKVSGNAALRMQQEIRQQDGQSAPPVGDFRSAPLPPAVQHSQQQPQHVPQQPAARAPAAPAAPSNGTGERGSQNSAQAADPNCLDGTTETRDSDNLADWMLSVASKPRRSSTGKSSPVDSSSSGGGGSHGGNSASATVQPPAPPANEHSSSGGGRSRVSGGRGGVVSALAVETPAAGSSVIATAPRPAELTLAPEDCEPDWLLKASGVPRLSDLGLHPGQQHRQRGGGASDHATHQQQAAALRRHNNRLLAEAGVLNNVMPWTVSASSQGAEVEVQSEVVATPEPQPVAAGMQHAVANPTSGTPVEHKPHGEVQTDDYII